MQTHIAYALLNGATLKHDCLTHITTISWPEGYTSTIVGGPAWTAEVCRTLPVHIGGDHGRA